MARVDSTLDTALTRWRTKGLLSPQQVEVLRTEAEAEHERRHRARGRLWVSAVGAAAAFGSVVLFATEVWPALGEVGRTLLLLAAAASAYLLGLGLQRSARWSAAGELLRLTGLGVGLFGVVYSDNAFEAGSSYSRVMGVGALFAGAGAGWVAWRSRPRTAVGHVVFVLPFVASFLVYTFELGFNPVVWTLDGVWAAALVGVAVSIPRGAEGADRQRRLAVLITGAWIGFVLLFFTGAAVLDLSDHAVWPMDAWIVTMAVLTAWAATRAPTEAEADLLERHLALCVPVATALTVFSVAEALDWPGEVWLFAGAAVASAGLAWALRTRSTVGLATASGSIIVVIWIYTVERAEMALAATALLFFWVGSRIRES